MRRLSLCVLAALMATTTFASAAAEYTFEASEFERKPFELSGYVEYRHDHYTLNRGSAFYNLLYYNRERSTLERNATLLKLEGKYTRGSASLRARTHLEFVDDQIDGDRTVRFDEIVASWKPDAGLTVEAGKIPLKWGKGYAWNPVAFLERSKDPNDPELAREGYWMATADWVKTFDGSLKTLAFTPVALPVRNEVNSDYGRSGYTNFAAKLYLLWHDTDIDLLYANAGSRPARFGIDVSRNITSNLEVHAEWARTSNGERRVISATGAPRVTRNDTDSYLLGLRYLTAGEATIIAEYYRNGAGFTESEFGDFVSFVDASVLQYQATGSDAALQRASAAAQAGYARPQPMQRYAYLRASQKDALGILYFTPAVTAIVNLTDGSFSLAPELVYTRVTNLELRLRYLLLHGGDRTDFGERQNSRRVELRARLFF